MVERYAAQYGISEYVNVPFAIIQVESGGTLEDVMQSSESMGLPPNSLGTEQSIAQGCKYFSELIDKADRLGCDLDSVIQAYNYGGGFLDYVASHGGKYSFELAQAFAEEKSGGVRVTYKKRDFSRGKRRLAVRLWKYVLCPAGIGVFVCRTV